MLGDEWMDGWMDEWMDEWMDGCMDGWIDSWALTAFEVPCVAGRLSDHLQLT